MRLLESLLIAGAFGTMFAMIFFAVALYVIWYIIVFVVGLVISLVKIAFFGFVLFLSFAGSIAKLQVRNKSMSDSRTKEPGYRFAYVPLMLP